MEKIVKNLKKALSNKNKTEIIQIMTIIINNFLQENFTINQKEFWMKDYKSSDITRFITLLEDKKPIIRKMALLSLIIILLNEQSKIFFTEKCGLVSKNGKVFLSRLKYLKLNIGDLSKSLEVLKFLMKKNEPIVDKNYLFWYINLKSKRDLKFEEIKSDLKYKLFEKKNILVNNGKINYLSIPDPIYNLCGVEIFVSESILNEIKISSIKSKSSFKSKRKSSRISSRPDRSKSPMVRNLKTPSITRRANEFAQNNRSKMNKKFVKKSKKDIQTKKKKSTNKIYTKNYRTKSMIKKKGIDIYDKKNYGTSKSPARSYLKQKTLNISKAYRTSKKK